MRIRFFNTFEPVNTFYRDLLPFLAGLDTEVELFLSRAEYRAARGRLQEVLTSSNISFRWITSAGVNVGGKLSKLWIMLAYIAGTMLRTLFGRPADLNFFLTQPPLFAVWGYLLKLIRRQPYICLVMDLYPHVAVQGELLRREALLTRFLKTVAGFGLRQADAVVVIGRCMAGRVQALGIQPERIHTIPNWANEQNLYPVPRSDNTLRRELGLGDDFIVLYSGNMGVSHFFEDILAVARRCRNVAGLRFVFIGGGARRTEIEQAIADEPLDNLLLLPFQPVDRLAESLSLGDVHFISLRPGFEGLVVPSKAYGALAVGRPIIYQGSPEGEIGQMVAEGQAGTVVPAGNPDALEQAVLAYYNDRILVAAHGQNALALARGPFSRQKALEQYRTLLLGA